ncbi:MAG: acetate--CoA ligase family protein [Chloroflexi bacterium]|nr:acetate--CoA ligase family protein [Chloroflexota bacterium]
MDYKAILENARASGRTLLTEVESKEVLAAAGIPITTTRLARSRDEAVAIAQDIGLPVVLKIASTDIVHKSDVGGVKLNLTTPEEVAAAYDDIVQAVRSQYPHASIDGVSVQTMARPGTEVILGMTKDPQFGPVLMFGLGGILVEVLKDVSFRIVPITRRDAQQMIREIKAFPVLQGYRSLAPADLDALENLLLKLSEFADHNPEVKELDLNPVFAYSSGAVAVDARIILESPQS